MELSTGLSVSSLTPETFEKLVAGSNVVGVGGDEGVFFEGGAGATPPVGLKALKSPVPVLVVGDMNIDTKFRKGVKATQQFEAVEEAGLGEPPESPPRHVRAQVTI